MFELLVKPIADTVNNVIDKFVPDKNESMRLKFELVNQLEKTARTEVENRMKVIIAEAQGKSWMQRNWRPILMLSIVAMVINNYILVPYFSAFGLPIQILSLPDKLFNLMEIGVGGYVIGRSAEKISGIVRSSNEIK